MAVPDKNIITPSPSVDNSVATVGVADTALASQSAQADIDAAQRQQEAAQANITNDDMFPGMDQKINVGSSTSQTLGTQPIFVAAGQYVPYNILNKKEEAIAEASKKRAARQAKFDPGKAAQLKNKLYQRSLNDDFNKMNSEFIKTAQTISPDNWDVMLNNPGSEIGKLYAQQKSNFEVLAQESDVFFGRAAEVINDAEKGGLTQFSPEVIAMAREVQGRTTNAVQGGLENLKEFNDKFNGRYDLDKHILENKFITQVKADIDAKLAPGGGGMTVETIADYTKQAEAIAKSETSRGGRYEGDDLITEEVYKDRLLAQWGIQKDIKHKYEQKLSTYDKKKGEEVEDTQSRFETIENIVEDIRSDNARKTVGGMLGNTFAGENVVEAGVSVPEDFVKYDNASDEIISVFEGSKDKRVGGLYFDWTKSDEIETKGKEVLVGALKKLGKGSDQISSVTKGSDGNIIVDTGRDKVSVDLNSKDKGKKALSDLLIKISNEKEAIAARGNDNVRIVTEKNGVQTKHYVKVGDPRIRKLMNSSMNTGKAENQKIKQKDLDKKYDEKFKAKNAAFKKVEDIFKSTGEEYTDKDVQDYIDSQK